MDLFSVLSPYTGLRENLERLQCRKCQGLNRTVESRNVAPLQVVILQWNGL